MTRNAGWRIGMLGAGVVLVMAGCLSVTGSPRLPALVSEAAGSAEEVILYSLEPSPPGGAAENGTETDRFHGHKVLGRTEVKNPADRWRLFAALRRGVEDHDGSAAACFIPHHGLRFRTAGRTVDLVVCFKCAQVQVFSDDKPDDSFVISTSPRPVFNAVLDGAKVPVSPEGR